MSRAHLYRPVTDNEGNVVPNTVITIYEPGTTQVLGQVIWSDAHSSLTPLTNPWTTSDGFIEFYLDVPQTVRIGLQVQGGPQTFIENIAVQPAPENLVYGQTGFKILNSAAAGQFLQSGLPGFAQWVDADDVVHGKPTLIQQLRDYDWSNSSLNGATLVDSTGATVVPTYADVSVDTKPSGWTFTKALQLPLTHPVTLRAALQTFPEVGQVIYLFKVVSANAGVGAATVQAAVDDVLLSTTTPVDPSQLNTWQIGYLDRIPTGTHKITLVHTPGTDPASVVLLGPVWVQYGGNIPEHHHEGAGANSVALGPGAAAAFAGATAVGDTAQALGIDATALGFQSSAGALSTAVGQGAIAGTQAVAVGANAGGSSLHTSWVSLGFLSAVGADNAVAVGAAAVAQGDSSIALGNQAFGAAAQSIAIGAQAKAAGLASVALGQGATVSANHDYSIAIGPGVATSAAHQAVIGDNTTTLVVPGSLRQVGGDTLLGGTSNKVGFFGSSGVTRPVVVGSRGGNAVLAQLLTALNGMGLVTDQSTA